MGTHGEQGTNPKNPNPIRRGCIASTTSWAKILAQFFCQANQLECFSFQTYFTRHLLGCSRVRFPQGVKAKVEPKLSNLLLVQPLKGIPRALHLESRPN